MRELFNMDLKDYKGTEEVYSRPSARALIERDGKLLLIYSKKYEYFKFPGGGIENGETPIDALIREVKEETGYSVIPDSVKEYGCVPRRQLSTTRENEIFEQINYYYTCSISDEPAADRKTEDYEIEGEYVVRWENPVIASRYNHYSKPDKIWEQMVKREEKILEAMGTGVVVHLRYFDERRQI